MRLSSGWKAPPAVQLTAGSPRHDATDRSDARWEEPCRPGSYTGRRALGVIDDAQRDRWREKVIRFVDKPLRRSVMEFVGDAGRMEGMVP
jgi:hypothetical protein